jgi:hypothetical protein
VRGGRGGECNPAETRGDELTRAEKAGILYELLGDDIDGVASMMDE